MLASSNQGSEVSATLRFANRSLAWTHLNLGTGASGIMGQFGPVDFELGVTTGKVTLNPLSSCLIDAPEH